MRRFIESQGWEAADTYSDIDISGLTEAKRPQFLKLKKDYAAGKFDIAVADDFSRFSRNKADAMNLLGSMNIATAKEGVADASDDFMPAMYFLLADKFSKDMSKRWRHALMHRLGNGLPPSGKAQFGYDKQGKEAYVQNADAEVLREAYARYTAGEGARTICADFTARGLAAAGPNGWAPRGFFDLLDKVFYAGKIGYEGQEFPGAHEPILDAAQWAAYQRAREGRKLQEKPRNPKWMLAGLAVCGLCGGKMVSNTARGVASLACSTYNAKGKAGCSGIFRKRVQVEMAVWWWLGANYEAWASIMPTDEDARIAAEKAVADAQEAQDAAQGRMDDLLLRAVRMGLSDALIAGPLKELQAELEEASKATQEALAELGSFTPVADLDEQISQGSLLMGFEKDPDAPVSEEATARFREALSKVIEKVVVLPSSTKSARDPERNFRKEVMVVIK